jgi:biopolymer transport protein ExbD
MNSSDTCAPELNVTPLIDVLLVLLTMLILTIPVLTHSVNLELPAQASSANANVPVQVDVDFDGRVYWNGEPVVDDAQLRQRFTQLAALDPQPGLKITPDGHGQYGRVAQVMAAAQRAGVTRMGLTPTP